MAAIIHKMKTKPEEIQHDVPDLSAEATTLEGVLKKDDLDQAAYNRLMIVYRKQKEYKKETALIKNAIAVYENFYKKHQPPHTAKIASLSKALSISTGLATKKGKALYEPEPINTWRKRLITAEKRAKKK